MRQNATNIPSYQLAVVLLIGGLIPFCGQLAINWKLDDRLHSTRQELTQTRQQLIQMRREANVKSAAELRQWNQIELEGPEAGWEELQQWRKVGMAVFTESPARPFGGLFSFDQSPPFGGLFHYLILVSL